jgi:hypothetical protein
VAHHACHSLVGDSSQPCHSCVGGVHILSTLGAHRDHAVWEFGTTRKHSLHQLTKVHGVEQRRNQDDLQTDTANTNTMTIQRNVRSKQFGLTEPLKVVFLMYCANPKVSVKIVLSKGYSFDLVDRHEFVWQICEAAELTGVLKISGCLFAGQMCVTVCISIDLVV